MVQPIAWILVIVAVLLELFAARQQLVTYGSARIDEAGSRRVHVAWIVSVVLIAAASVLAGRQAGGSFVIGLTAFRVAVIVNQSARRSAMCGYENRKAQRGVAAKVRQR